MITSDGSVNSVLVGALRLRSWAGRATSPLTSGGPVIELDGPTRLLGIRLGLGDLQQHPPCHGFACGCVCDECELRVLNPLPAPVRVCAFPWEDAA